MAFTALLVASLQIVFGIWLRLLSFCLRSPDSSVMDSRGNETSIKASASASSSDPLTSPSSDSRCNTLEDDSHLMETPELTTASTPDLRAFTPQHFPRSGRTCNIFSPPTARKQFPAAAWFTGPSCASSVPNTPEASVLSTSAIDPPLIFAFDEESDDTGVDLERGLCIQSEGGAISRSNSGFLGGSSVSLFSKLNGSLLSASRPTTPSAISKAVRLIQPLSPTRAQDTLPLFFQDVTDDQLIRESTSCFMDSASYAATYSGSPEADLRLEAFHHYSFSPYTPSIAGTHDAREGDASRCATQILSAASQAFRSSESPGALPSRVRAGTIDVGSVQRKHHPFHHPSNPRFRPLFLPKELASRQGIHSKPVRKAFSPRPLLLPQQIARRSLDVEAIITDMTNPPSLLDSHSMPSFPTTYEVHRLYEDVVNPDSSSESDMVLQRSVCLSQPRLECHSSLSVLLNSSEEHEIGDCLNMFSVADVAQNPFYHDVPVENLA